MSSVTERIAAVLHDVVEDTPWTLDALREEGFSQEVVSAVEALTRREGDGYQDFVRRASRHAIARPVKREDLRDNLDLSRINDPGEEDQLRMQRYEAALRLLL